MFSIFFARTTNSFNTNENKKTARHMDNQRDVLIQNLVNKFRSLKYDHLVLFLIQQNCEVG